ncbi:MAG TPA: PAS domain-containing protein, partial [Burkholderiales bacterium]|nr:PAS domain-containing protein [Burkholderiales bacterium]
MQALEKIKRQWQFAADAMPQLICLVDRDGRIIRSNRTVERWKLGYVESVNGLFLHDVLHKHCSDPACYLRSMPQQTWLKLPEHGQAQHSGWDPILERHLVIRTQMPIRTPDQRDVPDDFFAVVTIDDVSDWRASEDRSKKNTQILSERVQREMAMRAEAEKVQSRLRTLLDKTPNLIAMANDTGELFYLNPAGRALLHVEAEDGIADLTLTSCHAPAMRDCLGNEAIPT